MRVGHKIRLLHHDLQWPIVLPLLKLMCYWCQWWTEVDDFHALMSPSSNWKSFSVNLLISEFRPRKHSEFYHSWLAHLRRKCLSYFFCTGQTNFVMAKLWGYMSQAVGTVQLWRKRVDFMDLGKWTAAKLPPVISIVSMFLWCTWQYMHKQNFRGLKGIFQMLSLSNLEKRNWSPK
jgi:hypothetical protein